MSRRHMTACLMLLLFVSPIRAEEEAATEPGPELPAIVMDGLQAYRTSGPESAVRTWFRHSVVERSAATKELMKELKKVHRVYGDIRAFHVVDVTEWSPTTQQVYLITDLEEGPLFWTFLVFERAARHVVMSAEFELEPKEIFPEKILEGAVN